MIILNNILFIYFIEFNQMAIQFISTLSLNSNIMADITNII